MAVLTDPRCQYPVSVLPHARRLPEPLQLRVELKRQLLFAYVFRDVANIQLPLGLGVARRCLALVVLPVVLKELRGRLSEAARLLSTLHALAF